ncbi:MAG: hypothetical protein A3I67_04905 [Chlamydiae bacterium RIFCSPLOWO2_02_FULL_45_22]|nr:MAG: hypothetical protein A3I67_04905 [Chlamydiae bacterium RIFCSPLOWO2_02_FULL_45_22]
MDRIPFFYNGVTLMTLPLSAHSSGASVNYIVPELFQSLNKKALDYLRNPYYTQSLELAFTALSEANIFTDENINDLIDHPDYALPLANIFVALHSKTLLDAHNRTLITRSPRHAGSFAETLNILEKASLTDSLICQALIDQYDHIELINRLFYILAVTECGIEKETNFLDMATCNQIIRNHKHLEAFIKVFSSLKSVGLLNVRSRDTILSASKYAEPLGKIFSALKRVNLLNQTTSDQCIVLYKHAKPLAEIFEPLQLAGLLNKETYDYFIQHPHQTGSLGDVFSFLQKGDLLNKNTYNSFIPFHEQAASFTSAFSSLSRARLFNTETLSTLIQYAQHIKSLAQIFNILVWPHRKITDANYKDMFLNADNYNAVMQHVQDAARLAEKLTTLRDNDILTQQTFLEALDSL